MNLHQGGMSPLKFTQLCNYAQALVATKRTIINKFVIGVCTWVEEECSAAMLHHDMNICRLVVYAQNIYYSIIMAINREVKRLCWMIKVNLPLRRGFIMHILPLGARIGFVTLLK